MAEITWDPQVATLSDRGLDVLQRHLSEVRTAHKIACEIHRPRQAGTVGQIADPSGRPVVKLRGKRSACHAAERDLDARRTLMVMDALAES
jgi:hypothetical protein